MGPLGWWWWIDGGSYPTFRRTWQEPLVVSRGIFEFGVQMWHKETNWIYDAISRHTRIGAPKLINRQFRHIVIAEPKTQTSMHIAQHRLEHGSFSILPCKIPFPLSSPHHTPHHTIFFSLFPLSPQKKIQLSLLMSISFPLLWPTAFSLLSSNYDASYY